MKKVGILMGSDSDLPIVRKAIDTLRQFDVPVEVHVYSAHRTPLEAKEFAQNARANGFGAIIAAAGMAAALPGVVASQTVLPVIGVPIAGSNLDGMDALMSIVQMPPGIPVATVAINGSKNAAYLALQIMAGKHESIKEQLWAERKEMEEAAMKANEEVIAKFS